MNGSQKDHFVVAVMASFHAGVVISTFLACLVLHIIDVPTSLLLLILNRVPPYLVLRWSHYSLSLSNEEEEPENEDS
jgi:hypothetical protein